MANLALNPNRLNTDLPKSMPSPVMTKAVKVFKNGASQAVRLPVEFRFDQAEIFATLDSATGNVILSKKPSENLWAEFFADKVELDDEGQAYMNERPMNAIPTDKAIF